MIDESSLEKEEVQGVWIDLRKYHVSIPCLVKIIAGGQHEDIFRYCES